MPGTPYDKQLLGIQAAASIQGDGTTPIAYGCGITRTATGVYKLVLPTGEAVTDAQSFTLVTTKGFGSAAAPGVALATASDESDFIKTVVTTDTAGLVVNCSIEMMLFRSTINPF